LNDIVRTRSLIFYATQIHLKQFIIMSILILSGV
jgi:hypothetical protein